MSSRFRTFLVTALVPLLVSTPALALDEDDYKALSHVLAVGLPAVAGGISLAKGGAAGLYQLAKSEAFTLAASEILKLTVNHRHRHIIAQTSRPRWLSGPPPTRTETPDDSA